MWLCLYLPQLPLNVYTRTSLAQQPLAIIEGQGNQQHVVSCNPSALHLGVTPGMRLSAAYALSGELLVKTRNTEAEYQALEQLAVWAGQFTSRIQLKPPFTLLLEIQGSSMLFGGITTLLSKIQHGLEELGYIAQQAVAQTPAAAELLARSGQEYALLQDHHLQSAVAACRVQFLEVEESIHEALISLGLRHVRDVLRLPRAGLNKRFGQAFVNYLDRLLGQAADPRPLFIAPEVFEQRVEIPFPVDKTEPLLFVGQRLLLALSGFLRARGGGTQTLHWTLFHEHSARTHFDITLVEVSRDAAHLVSLLKERLERLSLPATVHEMALRVTDVQTLVERSQALIDTPENKTGTDTWQQLVERLCSRMGEESVSGIQAHPDHRPERSWRYCAPGEAGPCADYALRPLWLLEQPQRLEIRQRQLFRHGYLQLMSGPERIQSGWWDGNDVQRDYFIAQNPQGQRYWIYREVEGLRAWFVHGIF